MSGSIIRTVVGTGVRGGRGDGGPARWAELTSPSALAFGQAGEIFIAEPVRNTVRVVDLNSGTIDLVCGTGRAEGGGEEMPARDSPLNNPQGLAIDNVRRRLYIAEYSSNRIRAVELEKGIIWTIAGAKGDLSRRRMQSEASFSGPVGLAVGKSGLLYIADQHHHQIKRLDPDSTAVAVVAGKEGKRGFAGDGSEAVSGDLNRPSGVSVDGRGNIYFSDEGNYRVRQIDHVGILRTIIGTGSPSDGGDGTPGSSASLGRPTYLANDSDERLIVVDRDNARIWLWSPESERVETIVGCGTHGFSGDGGPALLAEIDHPNAAVVGASGELYVADQGNHRVRCIAARQSPR